MSEVGTAVYAEWWKLNAEQQKAIQALRERINDRFIAETEAFYKVHPELRVDWQFTLSAYIWEATLSP